MPNFCKKDCCFSATEKDEDTNSTWNEWKTEFHDFHYSIENNSLTNTTKSVKNLRVVDEIVPAVDERIANITPSPWKIGDDTTEDSVEVLFLILV